MESGNLLKRLTVVILSVILFLAMIPVQNVQAEEPNLRLYAKAAVLMDADSGRVLYERCGDEQLAMASTTKIMTLIVTLENADLEDTVTVSSYAASMPEVKLHIRDGEQYRLKDLVLSLMLESHNDSAVAIAEHVGGSVEQFADKMNQKAVEIGCNHTYFITPNGLDATKGDKFHSTTAKDLATIMSYCITKSPKKEQFLEITRTPSHTFADVKGKRSFGCVNHNAFLSMMSGALTGKTGFTNKAGYCYVGALRRDGKTFVVALLACGWPNHKTYKWSDTRCLMEYGLENYQFRSFDEVEIPTEVFEAIPVDGAKGEKISSRESVSVKLSETAEPAVEKESAIGDTANKNIVQDQTQNNGLLLKESEKFTVTVHKKKELMAPVTAGQNVGYISYHVGNEEWKRVALVAAEEKEAIDFIWCLRQVVLYWAF